MVDLMVQKRIGHWAEYGWVGGNVTLHCILEVVKVRESVRLHTILRAFVFVLHIVPCPIRMSFELAPDE